MVYVSLSLVLVLLFGISSAAYALERIRIGLSVRNVVFLPFYYAQEKKIFEKHGLDAELIQIRSDLQVVGSGFRRDRFHAGDRTDGVCDRQRYAAQGHRGIV